MRHTRDNWEVLREVRRGKTVKTAVTNNKTSALADKNSFRPQIAFVSSNQSRPQLLDFEGRLVPPKSGHFWLLEQMSKAHGHMALD